MSYKPPPRASSITDKCLADTVEHTATFQRAMTNVFDFNCTLVAPNLSAEVGTASGKWLCIKKGVGSESPRKTTVWNWTWKGQLGTFEYHASLHDEICKKNIYLLDLFNVMQYVLEGLYVFYAYSIMRSQQWLVSAVVIFLQIISTCDISAEVMISYRLINMDFLHL